MAYLPDLYQYQEVTGPVFIPGATPAPDLSWKPEYPDKIDRKQFLPDQQQAYAANVQPEVTIARAWSPSYPDQIDRLLVHPSRIPSAFEPPFSVRDLGHIGWEPEYPDWIDRKTMSASLQQSIALELAARALGHMGWKPEYPDFARSAASVPWHQFLALDVFPRPDVTFVAPVYPDKLFSIFFQPPGGETAPPTDLARLWWYPTYPDRLFQVPTQLLGGETAPPPSVQPLGHIGWYPTYPDWLAFLQLDAANQLALAWSTFTPAAAPDFIPPVYQDWIARLLPQQPSSEVSPPSSVQPLGHIGWEPEYPDQIWRTLLPTASQQFLALDPFPIAAFPPEFLTWQSIYPDRIYPTPGLRHDLQQFFALWPEPLPNAPAPDLSWGPSYPDQIFRTVLPVAAMPFTWRNVEPVAAVATPDLSWKPVYPDQIYRPYLLVAQQWVTSRRLDAPAETVLSSWEPTYPNFIPRRVLPTAMREGNSIAAAIEQAVAPLKWEPRMPARLDPKRLPTALYPSFFEPVPGALIVIAQSLAWKFYEPSWLRRYPPVVPEAFFWTIPPFVPASAIDCVELIDDSFAVPALINQVFTAPLLLDEGLTVPKLIEQDLC